MTQMDQPAYWVYTTCTRMLTSTKLTIAMATTLRRSSRLLSATTVADATSSAKDSSSGSRPRVKRPRIAIEDNELSSGEDASLKPIKKRANKSARVATARPEAGLSVERQQANLNMSKTNKKGERVIEYSTSDFPQRPNSLWKIGPHVSAAGGVENAILNAASIGYVANIQGVPQAFDAYAA